MAPDHVAVTGDLTNVGLPDELDAAADWLRRLGGPTRVSVIPGNHDAYAAPVEPRAFARWAPYLEPNDLGDGASTSDHPARQGAFQFPYLRTVGPVALIGLSSAHPTPPLWATGRLGDAQRARLDVLLGELGGGARCRVVLVHHPPVAAGQSERRRLLDAAELRAILARHGAELVLHGHTHRASFERIDGPHGEIPVIGVPSSSAIGIRPGRRAAYHLYRIEPVAGSHFRISCAVRGLNADTLEFGPLSEREL